MGYKKIKACKLETDPTKFSLVLTAVKKPLDSERSAHEWSPSGTCVSD